MIGEKVDRSFLNAASFIDFLLKLICRAKACCCTVSKFGFKIGGFFPNSVSLGSSVIVKVPEQLEQPKSHCARFPGSQEHVPKQGSQEQVAKQGSPEVVPK